MKNCARAGGCAGSNYPFLTSKERDNETGLDYFLARYYSSAQGRFTSADPLGGHTEDPQTLNRYTYVRNNSPVLTDPTGLDFYLQCEGKNANCQGGRAGTTDKKGNFTATLISNDSKGNLVDQAGNSYTAKITGQGVSFNGAGSKEYVSGVFLNGTKATTIQGTGDLAGFTFNFTASNLEVNQTAMGTFTFNGTASQASEALNKAGYVKYARDRFNFYHPSGIDYDAITLRSPGGKDGENSGHFTVYSPVTNSYQPSPTGDFYKVRIPKATVPSRGDVHFGETNPWVSVTGAKRHAEELTLPRP